MSDAPARDSVGNIVPTPETQIIGRRRVSMETKTEAGDAVTEKPTGKPTKTREPYVYRCSKHSYVLETTAPKIGASLRIFCPLCKDEWFAKHLHELQNENPNAGKLIER